MNNNRELFNWLDSEIFSIDAAMDFAREHLNEIIDSAYQNCVRKVWTTQGYDLGIANPDLILHRVIGGRKKGRIVKKIPQNANYSEIGYDKDGAPLYFKNINIYGSEDTYFFFQYDGFTWAMELESVNRGETRRRISTYNIKKFCFDEKGRIHSYADISRSGSAIVTVYEYPEEPEQPIICHFYYYVAFTLLRTVKPLVWYVKQLEKLLSSRLFRMTVFNLAEENLKAETTSSIQTAIRWWQAMRILSTMLKQQSF